MGQENIQITLENLRHTNKIKEMSFERETQLVILNESWKLSNLQTQHQQPQYYPQEVRYQEPVQRRVKYPEQDYENEEESDELKSKRKYARGGS